MVEHHSWYIGSVWHKDWHQVYVGQWPIFYGPVILLHILKTVWWRNVVLGIMDQGDTKIDLLKYMWVSDLYFMVHWFCLFIIVINLNYLYTLTNGAGRGYSCPSRHLLSFYYQKWLSEQFPLWSVSKNEILLFKNFSNYNWFPKFLSDHQSVACKWTIFDYNGTLAQHKIWYFILNKIPLNSYFRLRTRQNIKLVMYLRWSLVKQLLA